MEGEADNRVLRRGDGRGGGARGEERKRDVVNPMLSLRRGGESSRGVDAKSARVLLVALWCGASSSSDPS